MKQLFLRFFTVFLIISMVFGGALTVRAISPSLSVTSLGSGDSVTVSVSGDPYASVVLYYQSPGYTLQSQYVGTTNSSGYLSTTVYSSTYGIMPGSLVYVMVNNQTSQSVSWPYTSYNGNYYNNNYYGVLSLSQTNVSVTVGQSATVTISGGSQPYGIYQASQNIFQPVLSGNNLQIIGLASGTGSMSVCPSGSVSNGCSVVYVTVNPANYYNYNNYNNTNYNYGYNQQPTITFSQTNPTLAIGQMLSIAISGLTPYNTNGVGYYVEHNSNTSNLQTSINGSTLTLTGLSAGNVAVTVCSSSMNCSALTVTVGPTNMNTGGGYDSWTFCAREGQFCSFPGTQTVQYGANGAYTYRTVTNGILCSNSVFGDPIFGVAKTCSYRIGQ